MEGDFFHENEVTDVMSYDRLVLSPMYQDIHSLGTQSLPQPQEVLVRLGHGPFVYKVMCEVMSRDAKIPTPGSISHGDR